MIKRLGLDSPGHTTRDSNLDTWTINSNITQIEEITTTQCNLFHAYLQYLEAPYLIINPKKYEKCYFKCTFHSEPYFL